MKKTISIDQLRPGMYIVGIDQSWFKTPFLRHKRTVRDKGELAILRKCGVRHVYIDIDKGDDVTPSEPAREGPRTTAVDEELPIARAVREEAYDAVERIFDGILTGQPIASEPTKKIVHNLLESITRRPQASLLLTMQQLNAHLHAHSVDTCILSLVVGTATGVLPDQLEVLGSAALLHDVGLLRLPRNLIRKNGPLTQQERQIFQTHPRLGAAVLEELPDPEPGLVTIIAQHHERVDGSGYPDGIQTPVPFAQIVAVCDAYSELLTGQGDHVPHTPPLAQGKLVQLGEEGRFDQLLVEQVLKAWGISRQSQPEADRPTDTEAHEVQSSPLAVSDIAANHGIPALPTPEPAPEPEIAAPLPDQPEETEAEDQIFAGKTVSSLLEEYPQLMQYLHTAVSKRTAQPVERAAQSIKSAAYSMGDTETYEAALRVEQLSHAENFRHLPPALHKLEEELQRLYARLFNSAPSTNRGSPSLRSGERSADAEFAHLGIVVADKIPDSRVRLCNLLRRQGVRDLRQAADGPSALQALQECPPDLLIADWDLPGLSGIEVLRAMRQDDRLKQTPMLMITGTATRKEVIEAAQAGVNGYLLKPFTLQVLTEQLRKILPSRESILTTWRDQQHF